jgi:CTP:molybdopterin cytidylyltransferase MocA
MESTDRRETRNVATGIVLAAGRSTRMGRPKALLVRDGESFLDRCARVLRAGGCTDLVVVVNGADGATLAAAERAGRTVIAPPEVAPMPIDSLRLGVHALSGDAACAVVLPVDCPFVGVRTVQALLASYDAHDCDAVVPVFDGGPGHPVVLGRALFSALEQPWPEGLRSLLDAHADRVVRMETPDAGVTVDVDTPLDARRAGVDA